MTQSSLTSIRMDPTSRRRDSSFGNTPATLVLRFSSLFTRSTILVVRIRFQCYSSELEVYDALKRAGCSPERDVAPGGQAREGKNTKNLDFRVRPDGRDNLHRGHDTPDEPGDSVNVQ